MGPFGYIDTTFAVRAFNIGKKSIIESGAGAKANCPKAGFLRHGIALPGGETLGMLHLRG